MFEENDSSKVLSELQMGGVENLYQLFENNRHNLRGMIKRMTSDQLASRFDPSDIIQEAFIRAESLLEKYLATPSVHPAIWIRILCRQALFEQSRKHFRACRTPIREIGVVDGLPVIEILADSTSSVGSKVATKEMRTTLLRQVAQLGGVDRELIEMRHNECMTFQEIGQLLELKTETAKKRYYRALEKLRALSEPSTD